MTLSPRPIARCRCSGTRPGCACWSRSTAGQLSAAAARVGIGQPSASEHLRLLEPAAGQRLVERSGRGSRLTEAGRSSPLTPDRHSPTLGAGEEELTRSPASTGTIHLGASTAPGVYLLPDTLGCFRRDYPNVPSRSRSLPAARSRPTAGRPRPARARRRDGGRRADRARAVPGATRSSGSPTRPSAGAARPVRPRSPRRADAARPRAQVEHAPLADRALAERRRQAGRVWELGSSEAVKRAARAGLGVAFLSRYAVAEEVERGELERFRLAGRRQRRLYVARLAGRPRSPSEHGFVVHWRAAARRATRTPPPASPDAPRRPRRSSAGNASAGVDSGRLHSSVSEPCGQSSFLRGHKPFLFVRPATSRRSKMALFAGILLQTFGPRDWATKPYVAS